MAITASTVTAAASTLTPTLAFGYTATLGDLLVCGMGTDAAHTGIAWPSPWVELREDVITTTARSSVAYLMATGGETQVLPVATGVADRWEGVIWRIPVGEWHGNTAPECGAPTATATVNPNPPSITPSWGSEPNNIYIAICMRDDSVANTITVYPTNYSTAQLDNNATTSGCDCGGAVRIVTGSPEDPGTFTISAAENANAYTVAVRPLPRRKRPEPMTQLLAQ